jgi:hypothetical protein
MSIFHLPVTRPSSLRCVFEIGSNKKGLQILKTICKPFLEFRVLTIFNPVNSFSCAIQVLTSIPYSKLNYMFKYCATFRRIRKMRSDTATSTLLSYHLNFAVFAIFISPCLNIFCSPHLNIFFINNIGTCLKIFSFI